jgi:hypothetical protein
LFIEKKDKKSCEREIREGQANHTLTINCCRYLRAINGFFNLAPETKVRPWLILKCAAFNLRQFVFGLNLRYFYTVFYNNKIWISKILTSTPSF